MCAEAAMDLQSLKSLIRDIPDFPKKGILFKDITPLLKDGQALKFATDRLADRFRHEKIDQVVGIESRGFILGPILAYQLGTGFVPVRKEGKLPAAKQSVTYSLEYGEDVLEIHEDAIEQGSRVLIADDLLATGGTAAAVTQLVERLGGQVAGLAFIVELAFLNGRKRIENLRIESLISY